MDPRPTAILIVLAFALSATPMALGDDPPTLEEMTERYVPRPVGVERDMTFFFGPYSIPPGQDRNQVTLDLPIHGGFITSIAPNLIDAQTGEEPSDLDMHIHHAHWFRMSNDPADEYYTLNLAWVFGTGEEKTQGSIHDRSDADPDGPRYGIYIPEAQPQALIFMLHNKLSTTQTAYILLDVTFTYGTEEEIAAADSCPDLQLTETCWAGADFNPLYGKLWGATFDVPRQALGDGTYVHPRDIDPADDALALGNHFEAPHDGIAIATAGHLHPNGREVVIANLGPEGSGCEADLDGDGYAGVTLLRSTKIERDPDAAPHSEEYQMGVSQFGWRAPIRAGDRITQFGVYQNDDYAAYEAMSYVGLYVDREQTPPELGTGGCDLSTLAPTLIDDPTGDPTLGVVNHGWHHDPLPLCNLQGMLPDKPDCHRPEATRPLGFETNVVHMSAFAYVPGDLALSGALGAPPRVQAGETLWFVNEDAGINVRHSATSCEWPCNGPYVGNYPQPDGAFSTGKLGNLDYIDGGLQGEDTYPAYGLDTSDHDPGKYAYYCLIHPWMRGAFEVV
ncbi:MAG: hypothetical protein KY455_12915 [Euryarchaeota archaeon]|nr:hypothetical protein [Euryarchaeota archaeon]